MQDGDSFEVVAGRRSIKKIGIVPRQGTARKGVVTQSGDTKRIQWQEEEEEGEEEKRGQASLLKEG